MVTTILPTKATIEKPTATNDVAHSELVADPALPQFQAETAPFIVPAVAQTTYQPAPAPAPAVAATATSVTASSAEALVETTNEHWINHKWRPAMGWMYMAVCVFDFILFPIFWSILQAISKGNVTSQWQPLTLQGAGLFHLAMGAVLGIAAYGRTKEKIETRV